jgi:hypothetical protein
MGIADTDRTLPSNRMVFHVRRDLALYQRFRQNLEPVMEEYGLAEVEREAFRAQDLKKLGELGVHPYFLPQISRLFHSSVDNYNDSEAAKLYAKHMIDEDD